MRIIVVDFITEIAEKLAAPQRLNADNNTNFATNIRRLFKTQFLILQKYKIYKPDGTINNTAFALNRKGCL